MIFAFCVQIGLMRFFRRIKPTNDCLYAIGANSRAPSFTAFQFRDAKKAASFVARVCSFLILNVARRRNIAKIAKCVVARVAVNMVNVAGRPFTSHVKPGQTTGSVSSFVDADNCVSFRFGITGNRPRNNFTACFDAPSKATCFGIVVQQRTQLVKCDVKMAHAISLS